jgi:hypothetical protein
MENIAGVEAVPCLGGVIWLGDLGSSSSDGASPYRAGLPRCARRCQPPSTIENEHGHEHDLRGGTPNLTLTLTLALLQGAKEIPVAPEMTTLVVPEGGGLFRTVLLWIDVPVQTPTA